MEYWGPCKNSAVQLITLDGKGHWHSNDDAGVHTTKEIWAFFKKQSLSSGPAIAITSPATTATFTAPATINLAATATVSSGTITNVSFYNGTTLLGTDNTAPYSYSWSNVAAGTYSVRAVVTDNTNKTAEATQSIKVNVQQGPYNGIASVIPGIIQVEHFDVGGNGVAYNDAATGNTGGATFRTDEDVDLENCTDAGAGYNLGFSTAGEWLEYTVNVQTAGNYDLDLRLACSGTGRTVSVTMDGTSIAANVAVPNTAGWQTWQTVSVSNIALTAGQKVMRITIGATDYVNLNYVEFKKMITTGLDEETAEKVILFPNPSEDGYFNLSVATNWRLFNSLGELLFVGKESMINLSDYPSGVYVLESKFGRQKLVRK
jgi:hypothetical protein